MKISNRLKKWLVFGVTTVICTGIVVTLYSMEPDNQVELKEAAALKNVTIQEILPGIHQPWIKVYGEAASKWSTTLRSQVNGPIVHINENLQPGKHIKAGEIILEIDTVEYQANLAIAQLELENARVNLLKTQRQADQAMLDWKRSGFGDTPSSSLVFYEPQLAAAKAQVVSAKKTLKKAKKDLEYTRITSPYSGLVVERFADKGETLFSGDSIVKIESAEDIEIRVNLGIDQVRRIGDWQNAQVKIFDPTGKAQWIGKIVRSSGILDTKTRLQGFYIVPAKKSSGILPGMFVTASICGKKQENLLALPESSLTRDGYIWYTDDNDLLRNIKAAVTFYEQGRVYIKNTGHFDHIRVVVSPIQAYISGTKVNPVLEGES
ncbi:MULTISPECIES: efflux RND transporter periplasmic adaptor subunit [Desulfobacula]|uniref:Predicted efflux transporter, RND family, membrane fusion protein n=2 Tax=Desulfobacula TaxID=28222 RepID=K0NFS8_DESTT|nr:MULTISPECIES: efflux RND transporter periplasmic adaptor subunit [Desulfobacula]CCK78573.1 predicted efflux transporter, RND family, membrane fusion protein [Desulfobacula toluolica Tol2]SDT89709.1 RND family efflux transporter, MFP subunit [Desulfobacula phenolica]